MHTLLNRYILKSRNAITYMYLRWIVSRDYTTPFDYLIVKMLSQKYFGIENMFFI
jgi:hypothetical protein